MTYDKTYARDILGADCDNCPLRTAGQFVPTMGPEDAAIAFVGEAPGAGESRTGVPFTGPSGRLLDIVIEKNGINRDEALLTNATLCRAPDGKTPAVSAIRACKPRLHHELARVTETVVVLGNTASESILGVGGVTKLRIGPGRTSPYDGLGHLRIIPTVHPAACLRQSDMFPNLVTDISKVVASGKPWEEPEYDVIDDPAEAVAFFREVKHREESIYVDIECDIEKDTAFDHPDRYDMLCVGVGLYTPEGDIERIVVIGYNAFKNEDVQEAMAEALGVSKLDAHNGKFDLAALFPHLGPLELNFDTMLAGYALDERPMIHGLKYHAVEELGAPDYERELDKYNPKKLGYGVIPKPVLYKYNAYDIAAGMRLKMLQIKKLQTKEPKWWGDDKYTSRYEYKSLRELHDFLVDYGSNSLMYLELNGIKIDKEYNRDLHIQYGDRMDAIKARIREPLARRGFSGVNTFNPNSPQQVKGALAHLRVRVDSTDKDTVNSIIDSTRDKEGFEDAFEFCEILLEWRREAKLFGTYVKGVTNRMYKGRIYSSFLMHGTVTGRLASRNPNLQNIVREKHIKKQYIPGKPENVFVQADYKQAELRILTWLSDCAFFKEILNDPTRDLFDELTPRLFPRYEPKIEFLEKYGPDRWSDVRVRVKAFVYGLGYGRTEYSIAHEYKMSVAEAKVAKKNFFNTIPEVVEWQSWVQSQVKMGHDLISPFGRHRRYHLITEENWDDIKKEALAFLPQNTSSDICLRAMARVRRDLRGSGAFIRNIVHDSILVDSPPDIATDVAELLDRRMVESAVELVGDYIRFGTDVEVGKSWGALTKI